MFGVGRVENIRENMHEFEVEGMVDVLDPSVLG